jgi:hypothetical protein
VSFVAIRSPDASGQVTGAASALGRRDAQGIPAGWIGDGPVSRDHPCGVRLRAPDRRAGLWGSPRSRT